jgi:Uncharacterised nucleotidyltransferase
MSRPTRLAEAPPAGGSTTRPDSGPPGSGPPDSEPPGSGPAGSAPPSSGPDLGSLLETVKKAGVELKRAEIPFALCGSWAAYARGGPQSEHDADFALQEQDVPRALDVLEKAGFVAGDPAEDWLAKVYDGERLVDLIYRLSGQPVTAGMVSGCEQLEVGSVQMPVLSATDLVIAKLLSFNHHHCDFAWALPMVRALREQVDWPDVRRRTSQSPFAEAFLLLADRLGLTGCPPGAPGARPGEPGSAAPGNPASMGDPGRTSQPGETGQDGAGQDGGGADVR